MVERLLSLCKRRFIDHPRVLFFSTLAASQSKDRNDLTIEHPGIDRFLALLATSPYAPQQITLYRQRYNAGDRACTVCHDAELLHISWSGGRSQYLAADYELGACGNWPLSRASGLIYDCWTAPQARGMGIYPHVLAVLQQQLLNDYPEVWIYCLQLNAASRRGIEKAGFTLRGQRHAWRILGHFMACP